MRDRVIVRRLGWRASCVSAWRSCIAARRQRRSWRYRVAASPRWATPRSGRQTYGGNAGEVALALGFELLDWQQQVVDVALEHDEEGGLVYREIGVSVPRQCGKSTLVLCLLV